jgi:MFS family permease
MTEKLDRRDLRFVLACLLAIGVGATVTGVLFRKAFPEASIEFKVNRGEARRLAEDLLVQRGRSIAGMRFAGQFDVDETAKVYLERELGLERAGRLYGREARIWLWRMRWFRSGAKEEERVTLSPLGDLVGFRSVIPEDAPGGRPTQEQARAVALSFLAGRGLSRADLKPIEATPVARPNRTDWTFVDEKVGVRFADATIRFTTTVSGGALTAYRETVHVPEVWTRNYERLRSKNEAAGQVDTLALIVTFIAMLGVLLTKIVRRDVRWRVVAAFGLVGFVLALLSTLNELPLTLFSYDTASPLSAYLTNQILLGVLGAVATGAGVAFVVAAAEPIYRERFPRQFSLAGAFSLRGLQTKSFLRAVLLGYALVAFFFAYQAVFYVVAARFGAWAPADVPYSDMLNTAFPWATVLFIGFLPAVTEEGISRMFSISFLDRLGAGRFLAVVVPAFIWGFGHSTYPNQPFYIRGIEVGFAGILIGFLLLRFGVVPLLVWHFTVDAIYTALILLRSGNSYYVISGAVASGILLLPLLASLVLYARRGGFLPSAGLTNADSGFVPAPPVPSRSSEEIPDVRPLSARVRTYAGAAALLLVSSFLVPAGRPGALVEDRTGRPEAERIARRFLQANGVDPADWRSVAYQGTGFADDEQVRQARPQEEGGLPGFSDAAARYVIEQGGPSAFERLAARQLPLAYWVVRFFQAEKKAEWKVLIDARRGRVVSFLNPVEEDAPATAPPSPGDARRRALAAAGSLGYPVADYTVLEVGSEKRPRRVDTTVVLQATPAGVGEARPRLTAVFHGPRLAAFIPTIHVPESFLRAERKRSVGQTLLLFLKIVAVGSLVGLVILLFLRLVRRGDFRWRSLLRPLAWAGILGAAGLANTAPYLFRRYPTEIPIGLFRLGLGVSLLAAMLGLLIGACTGFVLYGGARPGWGAALRRRGSLRDALWRAALAAAGVLGLARWMHVVASRVPALYEPDPSLPSSLQYAIPALDVVWTAARGVFALAALAAAAALAARSSYLRSAAGKALGIGALLIAFAPTSFHSPGDFAADFLPALLMAAWLAVACFALLRDHAAAWVLFGILAFGGREAIDLLAQPSAWDRSAGWLAVLLLLAAGAALLAGRRTVGPAAPPGASEPSALTTPWSGTS